MKSNHKIEIEIIIVDGNPCHNYLISEKLRMFSLRPEIFIKYAFSIRRYDCAGEYLKQSPGARSGGHATLAFIDDNIGEEEVNRVIFRDLISCSKRLTLIYMTDRNQEEEMLINGDLEKYGFININKHEYTPEICLILVENYIKNL